MRAMPSPISMTVPTSVTCSFCSNPAISRFRTFVISATLMAMGTPKSGQLSAFSGQPIRCLADS
jgi:hypothetical protein